MLLCNISKCTTSIQVSISIVHVKLLETMKIPSILCHSSSVTVTVPSWTQGGKHWGFVYTQTKYKNTYMIKLVYKINLEQYFEKIYEKFTSTKQIIYN